MNFKAIYVLIGGIGTTIASLLGGWDTAMQTLLIFMAVDYLSGFLVAAVFKNSPKTNGGALSSSAGLRGLVKKIFMLTLVIVASQLDCILELNHIIRTGVVIAFCTNELVSIIENAGLMGIPLPKILTNAIELLRKKGE